MAHLHKRGCRVLLYEADKVAKGDIPLELVMEPCRATLLRYDRTHIAADTIQAAWLRRPSTFGPYDPSHDAALRMSIDRERRASQRFFWELLPQECWLNAPAAIHTAQQKISQLALARRLGFTVPYTVVSNDWATIRAMPADMLVYKAHRSSLSTAQTFKYVFTTMLTKKMVTGLAQSSPFPGIWQVYIPKSQEWRVTIVDKEAFAVAITTSRQAKDDWRRWQGDPAHVKFRAEVFPAALIRKCQRMLRTYKLRYGAFDLIQSSDGTITFLEMNPAGQYGWLERTLSLPISAAVSDTLFKIATR